MVVCHMAQEFTKIQTSFLIAFKFDADEDI